METHNDTLNSNTSGTLAPPPASPSIAPAISMPAPTPAASHPDASTSSSADTSASRTSSFRTIVNEHALFAEEDDCENDPVRDSSGIRGPWKIADLFDFASNHWVVVYGRSAHRSFQEELELYELLDGDEEGTGTVNIELDDSTADVLLN